ncbi:MAG: hypothetical protein ACREBC_14240, partial [Pyrinomonadaceae bacterium]
MSSLSDDASDQLFAVNESGSVLRDISTSLPGVSVWKVYPARNGRYAWIFSENWQVYVVDANGHPLNGGTPLFSGMKFNGLDTASNGGVSWLSASSELARSVNRKPGLYVYDVEKGELNDGLPLLENQLISDFWVTQDGRGAFVKNIKGQIFLVSLANPQSALHPIVEGLGIVSIERFAEGSRAWVISLHSSKNGLLLYDPTSGPLDPERRALSAQSDQLGSMVLQHNGGKVLLLTLHELLRRPMDDGLN